MTTIDDELSNRQEDDVTNLAPRTKNRRRDKRNEMMRGQFFRGSKQTYRGLRRKLMNKHNFEKQNTPAYCLLPCKSPKSSVEYVRQRVSRFQSTLDSWSKQSSLSSSKNWARLLSSYHWLAWVFANDLFWPSAQFFLMEISCVWVE